MAKTQNTDVNVFKLVFIAYPNEKERMVMKSLKTRTEPHLIIIHQKRVNTKGLHLAEGFWVLVQSNINKRFLQRCVNLDKTRGIITQSWDYTYDKDSRHKIRIRRMLSSNKNIPKLSRKFIENAPAMLNAVENIINLGGS